ncbi:MAG TPA: hypothetical protein GX708_15675 [Gallicola sp.]|nr:hypothetical protein [Gallicola sp.]
MSNSTQVVSGSFYWTTQYYHPDNNFTMDDFLSHHLPEESIIHHIDGTYAEVEYEGRDYALHAGGNGDSFNHIIRWELLGGQLTRASFVTENKI